MPSIAAQATDGRQSRTARSRRAICDACIDLVAEGALQPSADDVAERAGVSRRSIFNHFADLAELYDAVLEVGVERAEAMIEELPSEGPLAERVDALIAARARFLEALAPFTRALTVQAFAGTASEQAVRVSRKALQLQRAFFADLLRDDLAGLSDLERRELLEALTSIISPLAWEHLRGGRGLSIARASAVTQRGVVALLRDVGLAL